MALQIFNEISHSAILAKGTLSEVTAYVAAMTSAQRLDAVFMSVEVTDKAGQEFWDITPTTIVPRVSVGKMSSFDVKAKNVTSSVSDTDTLQFVATGVVDTTLSTGANGERVITSQIKGNPVTQAGKIVRLDEFGDGFFDFEKVRDIDNTPTVDLQLDAEGVLQATAKGNGLKGITTNAGGIMAKLSTDTDQVMDFGSDGGLLVKGLKVGSASDDLLTITGNVIDMTKLGLAGEWYESTELTIADYVASAQFATDQPQLDDKVKIVNAIGKIEVWTAKVKNPTAAAHFIQTTGVDTTDAIIRSAINSGAGWNFNQTSGVGTARLRAVDSTHANDLKLDSLDLFVDVMATPSDIGFGEQGLGKNLTDLNSRAYIAYNRTYQSGLTKTTDSVTGAQTVALGGDLLGATAINVLDKSLNFTSTTGAINFTTDNVNFNNYFTLIAESGQVIQVYGNTLNVLKTRVPN